VIIEANILLSVDPMADKYPSMSPFMYCAGNPVRLVDPDGMDWEPSELTESQQKTWNNSMNLACSNSPLFKKMYDQIDKSGTKYKVKVGETQNNAPAQFNSETNTLTFREEGSISSEAAYIEEVFHVYQKDNFSLYESGKSFNREFEAKIGKLLIMKQMLTGGENMVEKNIEGMFNYLSPDGLIIDVPINFKLTVVNFKKNI